MGTGIAGRSGLPQPAARIVGRRGAARVDSLARVKCPVSRSKGAADDPRLVAPTELESVVECTRCWTDLLPGLTRWSRPTVISDAGFARLVRMRRPHVGATDEETAAWQNRTLDHYVARK